MHTGPSTTIDVGLKPLSRAVGVDVGFERRAGLPIRVGRAVELAGAIVASADHGANAAVEIGHDSCGLCRMIVTAELAQLVFNGLFGSALHVHVDCGADDEHPLGIGFREGIDQLAHFIECPIEIVVRRILVAAIDGGRGVAPRTEYLAFGHEAGVDKVI